MKVEQHRWTAADGWRPDVPGSLSRSAQLVLVFGATSVLGTQEPLEQIRETYPEARVLGCSTAGEVCGTQVLDESLVSTAVQFEGTDVRAVQTRLLQEVSSYQAGEQLAASLGEDGLTHVFVLSDGLHVNGSELVRGLIDHLPAGVAVTGGLAGDGPRFEQTLVCLDGAAEERKVAALGLYARAAGSQPVPRLRVGYGSVGGWDPFGPERLITRSEGNVLYEVDGRSALELYKKYLGEYASGLPASGLLFPLSLRMAGEETGLVRTILSVDEQAQSMTFAGDVPEGALARLMKANVERLIDGAIEAAEASCETMGHSSPDLAVLISCVGRKLVLRQRVEEEVEEASNVLGDHTVLAGFYSYGEIAPFASSAQCELHNQTMTITTFAEV